MASNEDEAEISPYELLSLTTDATEKDIKTAYRQRSLKVHPDRNPNNPDAARKFHELNQAYELLLDPLRRLALDAKVRVKQARAERFKSYDTKRKNLVEELEERERAHKKARVQKQKEEAESYHETERIKEEGRRLREEREKALRDKEREAATNSAMAEEELLLDPPPLDQFDTTVRLKYSLKSHPELTSKESIASFLAPFGAVDVDYIVFSTKTKSKSKSKAKSQGSTSTTSTHATALVPFKNISDAYASVSASSSSPFLVDLKGMEITWVNNKEPLILGWLRKLGKLPSGVAPHIQQPSSSSFPPSDGGSRPQSPPTTSGAGAGAGPLGGPPGSTPFSSFPDLATASSIPQPPPPPPSFSFTPSTASAAGLDYESLTLLRLRQAERERIEREIREREAEEDN